MVLATAGLDSCGLGGQAVDVPRVETVLDDVLPRVETVPRVKRYSDECTELAPFEGYYDRGALVAEWADGYDLHTVLDNLRFKETYRVHYYDCTQMSALMEWIAENMGYEAKIGCGNHHCWVLVRYEDGVWKAYESVAGGDTTAYVPAPHTYYSPDYGYASIEEVLAAGSDIVAEYNWWSKIWPERPWTWKRASVEDNAQQIRYSWYNPALGGTNCAVFRNGECVSTMSNGERWQDWMGRACACPPQWPFGTEVIVDGQTWICKDRGSAIQYVGGIPWVDFLTADPRHTYGEILTVQVRGA